MTDRKMTLKEAASEAILVQDACNLSGVVFAFARVMEALCEHARENGYGTDWRNTHPVCVLFASKISQLTACEHDSVFAKAYAEAKAMQEEDNADAA